MRMGDYVHQDDIEQAFTNIFRIFSSVHPTGVEGCLSVLPTRITAGMNEQLLQTFTKDEVSNALNQMAPLKAPGPDGFSADFFQEHWALLAMRYVLQCLVF
jgi:hypothetical protein